MHRNLTTLFPLSFSFLFRYLSFGFCSAPELISTSHLPWGSDQDCGDDKTLCIWDHFVMSLVRVRGRYVLWRIKNLKLIKTIHNDTQCYTNFLPLTEGRHKYWRAECKSTVDWFYFAREIGSRILHTIMQLFHCLLCLHVAISVHKSLSTASRVK